MSQVYQGLSAQDQARVMAVAIGRTNQKAYNSYYCQPGVMADDASNAQWAENDGYKRSMTFYKKEGGQWCYYCQFSMTYDDADFAPTVRALLDNPNICGGTPLPPSPPPLPPSPPPVTYPDSMPDADAVFRQAYLADPEADLIKTTQHACANMRDELSMSTACMLLSPAAVDNGSTALWFPVSVCCTTDYCLMRHQAVSFTYLAHSDGRHYLLREGLAVAVLSAGATSSTECEDAAAAATASHGRYFPLLAQAELDDACAPHEEVVPPSEVNLTVSTPVPPDATYALAAGGIATYVAVVASTHKQCAYMRATRSIATACMALPALPATAASTLPALYVPVSVCCSSDLCEIRTKAQEGSFAYATAPATGSGTADYFVIMDGVTVQAAGDGVATSAVECEAAVAANQSGAYHYPILPQSLVDDLCTPPSPPQPPPLSLGAASGANPPSNLLSSTSSPPPSPAAAALSTGVVVGIAVGGAALVLGLAALTCALCKRRASVSAVPARKCPEGAC